MDMVVGMVKVVAIVASMPIATAVKHIDIVAPIEGMVEVVANLHTIQID